MKWTVKINDAREEEPVRLVHMSQIENCEYVGLCSIAECSPILQEALAVFLTA